MKESNYTGIEIITVASEHLNEIYENKNIRASKVIGGFEHLYFENTYVILKDEDTQSEAAIAIKKGKYLYLLDDKQKIACGIRPKNTEQKMMFDALFDPKIQVVFLPGVAGSGKAQPLDSIVYTEDGPKKMGDVKIGDRVVAPDGSVSYVDGVFPQGVKKIYRVYFQDDSYTDCCDDHLWHTQTQRDRDYKRSGSVKSLKEIMKELRNKGGKRNHSIPITKPVQFLSNKLSISPYLMGALLGDGGISVGTIYFTNIDEDILNKVSSELKEYGMKLNYAQNYSYRVIHESKSERFNYVKKCLREYELWGCKSADKFIPDQYKYGSVEQRINLLRGIMDTDGTVSVNKKRGISCVSYTSVSKRLALDVQEVVQSLGGTARMTSRITSFNDKDGNKKKGQRSYRIFINMPNEINPFYTARKRDMVTKRTKYPPRRYIDRVDLLGEKECQCISINHSDHLYLTDNFIVTHNTIGAIAAAVQSVFDKEYEKIIYSRIMSQSGHYDIGTLPGDLQERYDPYLQAFHCNAELLQEGKRKFIDSLLKENRLEFIPAQLFRGASFARSYIIMDEVQTLTHKEMLTIGTRVGPGSKIVFCGDLNQRDEDISRFDTGFWAAINREGMKNSPIVSVVELVKSERGKVSALFSEVFNDID
jgi:hypothetical protein